MNIQIKRHLVGDTWTYESQEENEVAFLFSGYGFSLESFDTYLESLGDSPRAIQLHAWRSSAFHALRTNNELAIEGWLNALTASWFDARKTEIIQPLAIAGEKARLKRSADAKKSVEKRHNKPGGNNAKRDAIREIWAAGNYTNRDRCAEQECDHLGMIVTTARKHLKNIPKAKKPAKPP